MQQSKNIFLQYKLKNHRKNSLPHKINIDDNKKIFDNFADFKISHRYSKEIIPCYKQTIKEYFNLD
jgi:hypothetical protein